MNSVGSKHLDILFRYHRPRIMTVGSSTSTNFYRLRAVRLIRPFTEDKNNKTTATNSNSKDEGRSKEQQPKTPQWLHSKQRLSKTHVGDDRARGGRVGRWGTGGSRKPPGHVIQGTEDRVAGSHSDSSHPHLRPTDIPRLAARRGKSKVVHDSHEGLSEQQLLGLVVEQEDSTTEDYYDDTNTMEFVEKVDKDEYFLNKYNEMAMISQQHSKDDFWAQDIAQDEMEKNLQAQLFGWSLDDPRLEPDEFGKYNILDDPRDEPQQQQRREGRGDFGSPTDYEEAYFYKDVLNFDEPFPEIKDKQEINKVLPLARHGPNLDDFLEAMIEHPTKYAMVSRINEHAESQREPQPLRFPLRRDPTLDFVESHKAFVFAQGIDASVALLGSEDDYYANFSNVEHRHKVAQKISKIFKVDIRNVSPASFNAAYIGFESIKAAKIAFVRFQGKLLQHQPIVASKYSDERIDWTRVKPTKAREVKKFIENSSQESLLALTHLTPQPMACASLLHRLFPHCFTSTDANAPAAPEDICLVSPTMSLIRLSSPEAVAFLLASDSFAAKLKDLKPRAKLAVLKATRERVFDSFGGVNSSKMIQKKGKRILVEGDLPSIDFFKSHYGVLHLSNLPSNVTKKDITDFFQPYCHAARDILSSVELVQASDGTFMGAAFVGFDGLGEAEKAFADWQARNKHSLGGNLAQLRVLGEKKLIRGKKLHPRSERSAEELMEDLTHWERHVDPKKLEFLESYGIGKDVLDDVFIKVRYQNRTFGAIDQARVSERLEPWRPVGSRYSQFVRLYVETLCECMTTPENPGAMLQSLFLPNEEVDLELMDGKRKWPKKEKVFKS